MHINKCLHAYKRLFIDMYISNVHIKYVKLSIQAAIKRNTSITLGEIYFGFN